MALWVRIPPPVLMHICLLDKECWRDWWHYGMPLRIHYSKKGGRKNAKFITVWPFTGNWIQKRRFDFDNTTIRNPRPQVFFTNRED